LTNNIIITITISFIITISTIISIRHFNFESIRLKASVAE